WSWRYHDPERQLPMDQRHGAHRDLAHEEAVIAEAMTLWPHSPTDTPELLSGTDTARFTEHVLDDLAALDHLEVELTGTRPAALSIRAASYAGSARPITLSRLSPRVTPELLSVPDPARFTEHVLDDLAALDHLEVEITGPRHAYRELDGDPRVRITQQTSPGK